MSQQDLFKILAKFLNKNFMESVTNSAMTVYYASLKSQNVCFGDEIVKIWKSQILVTADGWD